MADLSEVYKVIDQMLERTTERDMFSKSEIQNWMLDMRSALSRYEDAIKEPELITT